MSELLGPLTYWHWFIAALVLLILEAFMPGAVFLWLGIAAGFTALLVLLVPSVLWQVQFVVFVVASVGSILAWRHYKQSQPPDQTDQPALNRRGEQYIGRVVTLDSAIVNGTGRIRLADTTWKVNGPDLPAGAKAKIAGVDGAVLRIEAAD